MLAWVDRSCVVCVPMCPPIREFIRRNARDFAQKNSQLEVKVQTQAGKHPILIGNYGEPKSNKAQVNQSKHTELRGRAFFVGAPLSPC